MNGTKLLKVLNFWGLRGCASLPRTPAPLYASEVSSIAVTDRDLTEERIAEAMARAERVACRPGEARCDAPRIDSKTPGPAARPKAAVAWAGSRPLLATMAGMFGST